MSYKKQIEWLLEYSCRMRKFFKDFHVQYINTGNILARETRQCFGDQEYLFGRISLRQSFYSLFKATLRSEYVDFDI